MEQIFLPKAWNFKHQASVTYMMMHNKLVNIFSWLIVALVLSCSSDDNGDGINPPIGELILQNIVGDWTATSAIFTTINSNPVLSRDVVTDGGTCDLSIFQDQRFSLVVRNPGSPNPQITTGLLVADGDFIVVRFDDDPTTEIPWDFTISGDDLTIAGPLDYDFENDGVFEESTATMQFIPN